METAKTSNRYSSQIRSRAVRMVLEHGQDHAVATIPARDKRLVRSAAQREAARLRLVDKLGRLSICDEPDTDDLKGKFHRLANEQTPAGHIGYEPCSGGSSDGLSLVDATSSPKVEAQEVRRTHGHPNRLFDDRCKSLNLLKFVGAAIETRIQLSLSAGRPAEGSG